MHKKVECQIWSSLVYIIIKFGITILVVFGTFSVFQRMQIVTSVFVINYSEWAMSCLIIIFVSELISLINLQFQNWFPECILLIERSSFKNPKLLYLGHKLFQYLNTSIIDLG